MGTIAKKEKNEVSTEVKAWGAADEFDQTDLVLSRLILTQDITKAVKDKGNDIESGQFILFPEKKPYNAKKPEIAQIQVFYSRRRWLHYELKSDGKRGDFLGQSPYTPANAGLPREGQYQGQSAINFLTYDFFALNPADKANAFPFIVSFSRSKLQTGKLLKTYFGKLQKQLNIPSAQKILELSVSLVKNNEGQEYYGIEFTEKREATPEELALARQWYDQIQAATIKEADFEGAEGMDGGDSEAGPY